MLQPHEIQNLIRVMNQLGRTTTEMINISDEINDGELIDRETRSVIRDGVVEVEEVSYSRMLDCGHIASASSIAATCDVCGRRVCSECCSICAKCNLLVCRYCYRIYVGEEGEETLCTACHWDVKRKDTVIRASKGIFRFFVKTKEG